MTWLGVNWLGMNWVGSLIRLANNIHKLSLVANTINVHRFHPIAMHWLEMIMLITMQAILNISFDTI